VTCLDEIARALQGYDPQALSAQAVGEFLHRLVEPLTDTEEVDLHSALDRVLAHELISPLSVPPHDNSAMDGYAFQGAQLVSGQALELEVLGTALAGRAWQGEVGASQCVKIMTGAVMPAGLDTVLPQEFSQDAGPGRIRVPANVVLPGDNRRCCGEDLMAGQVALSAGTRLGPAALGLIASLGLTQVQVRRRPKVAYFSTGDEILQPGEQPREGAVYDSNRHTVHAMLTRLGC
jgi:molybdopterin molybdotransferase